MFIGIVSLFPEMFRAITDYGVTGRAVKWPAERAVLESSRLHLRPASHRGRSPLWRRPGNADDGATFTGSHSCGESSGRRGSKGDLSVTSGAQAGSNRRVRTGGQSEDDSGVRPLRRIDERVIQTEIDEEWSIGDYVLSGGELPAMTLIDSVARFIPGVLGHQASAEEDSFADGLLDCPHYTRPEVLEGMEVPPVLLSGNHAEIRRWRLKQSLGRTRLEDLNF